MRQPFTPLIDLLATRCAACRRSLSRTEAMRFLPMALFSVLFVVGQTPTDGQGWFNQGLAQHREGKYQDAAGAFQKALDLGFNPPGAMMRIGRTWAKRGDVDKALEWMEKSAAAGFAAPGAILADSEVAASYQDCRGTRLKPRPHGLPGCSQIGPLTMRAPYGEPEPVHSSDGALAAVLDGRPRPGDRLRGRDSRRSDALHHIVGAQRSESIGTHDVYSAGGPESSPAGGAVAG